MRIRGEAVTAIDEKKAKRNRPPIKPAKVGAVAVTMAPMQTPRHPTKMASLRPRQSEIQTNRAPTI